MGALDRLILRDEQWERISPHIIGDERTRGSSGHDNRMFVEAVLLGGSSSLSQGALLDLYAAKTRQCSNKGIETGR